MWCGNFRSLSCPGLNMAAVVTPVPSSLVLSVSKRTCALATKISRGLLRFYVTQTEGDASRDSPESVKVKVPEGKPFSEIPCVDSIPIIGLIRFAVKYRGRFHESHEANREMYGPIWRVKDPGVDLVFTAHPQGMKDLLRYEGKHPNRVPIGLWLDAYQKLGKPRGLLQALGEEWQRLRKTVDKPILRPNLISGHVSGMHDVAADLVDRLTALREEDGEVKDVDQELFKWALESACLVLYDRRLGCLSSHPQPSSLTFIKAVQEMFRLTGELVFYPPALGKLIRPRAWKAFRDNMDVLFRYAEEEITHRLSETDSLNPSSFIGHILSRDSLTPDELVSTVTEIMSASVDTTSNSVHALLWEVARRPDVQDKMYDEISSVLPHGTEVTYQRLEKLAYTMGVIKEVTRLYPVGFVSARMLEEGAVVCGYQIPQGTQVYVSHYALGRNPEVFENPTELCPERWIRNSGVKPPDPFSYVPFGLGQRSCVGRRIAVSEMQLLCVE
ncbi:1,25-dihydroxyvitamin D(3) 24-hydroxylase, mitochondrial isoform X2 [Aplysia californica]|nr:1,25-dihydroxyvitamin D(3) 24-hydroxylase, mitochondrial isoform X2 [Aplysia californica]